MQNRNVLTVHGALRIKERIGVNEKKASRLIELAMERGEQWEETTDFLLKHYLKSNCSFDKIAIAYMNYCWIISKSTGQCITVIPLPMTLQEIEKSNNRNHRNIKRRRCMHVHK